MAPPRARHSWAARPRAGDSAPRRRRRPSQGRLWPAALAPVPAGGGATVGVATGLASSQASVPCPSRHGERCEDAPRSPRGAWVCPRLEQGQGSTPPARRPRPPHQQSTSWCSARAAGVRGEGIRHQPRLPAPLGPWPVSAPALAAFLGMIGAVTWAALLLHSVVRAGGQRPRQWRAASPSCRAAQRAHLWAISSRWASRSPSQKDACCRRFPRWVMW